MRALHVAECQRRAGRHALRQLSRFLVKCRLRRTRWLQFRSCAPPPPKAVPRCKTTPTRAIGPTSRGRKNVAPKSGYSPNCPNACVKIACSEAIRRSHASARLIPPPAAGPVHRRDHHLRHRRDGQADFLAHLQHRFKLMHGSAGPRIAHVVDVAARAKSAARPGQNNGPHGFVLACAQQAMDEPAAQLGIQGVQLLRPVQTGTSEPRPNALPGPSVTRDLLRYAHRGRSPALLRPAPNPLDPSAAPRVS